MSIRKASFWKKKQFTLYSRKLIETELVVSETQGT